MKERDPHYQEDQSPTSPLAATAPATDPAPPGAKLGKWGNLKKKAPAPSAEKPIPKWQEAEIWMQQARELRAKIVEQNIKDIDAMTAAISTSNIDAINAMLLRENTGNLLGWVERTGLAMAQKDASAEAYQLLQSAMLSRALADHDKNAVKDSLGKGITPHIPYLTQLLVDRFRHPEHPEKMDQEIRDWLQAEHPEQKDALAVYNVRIPATVGNEAVQENRFTTAESQRGALRDITAGVSGKSRSNI